jgi:ABC-type sugar transport system ATPase subunit
MSTADPPIIRVEGLTAGYDDFILLNQISFDVHRGEVFVILGGSGCGKSTLLKHMIGLYEPQAGHVFIDGDDITSAEGDARTAILRKIGVMYQSGALFGPMTLLENVRLPLRNTPNCRTRRSTLIGRMKLAPGSAVHRTSAGRHLGRQAKRAAIGAMALDPISCARRAIGGPRPHHVGVARRADPPPGREPRRDVRHRHARARASAIADRGPCSTSARRASSPKAIRACCATRAKTGVQPPSWREPEARRVTKT